MLSMNVLAGGDGRPSPVRRAIRAALAAALLLDAPAVLGQTTADSLTTYLSASDVHKRAEAVGRLNALPVAELTPAARRALVNLLEAEATGHAPASTDTSAAEDETYDEYIIALTDGVLRLKDPSALRGLALMGAQTSREAQQFIASFGARGLPYLDEAWQKSESARPTVVTTWAFAAALTGPNALNPTDRRRVLASIMSAAETYPIAIAGASRATSLVELAPLLSSLSTRVTSEVVRGRLAKALLELAPIRSQTSVATLLDRTSDWLTGFCTRGGGLDLESSANASKADDDRPATRQIACVALWWGLKLTRADVAAGRTDAARVRLGLVARAAAFARTRGIFTAAEADIVEGNARYLLTRI
jgi:hypothetical protein